MVQHREVRRNDSIGQLRLEEVAAELFNDPDLVEEGEVPSRMGRLCQISRVSNGHRGVRGIWGP